MTTETSATERSNAELFSLIPVVKITLLHMPGPSLAYRLDQPQSWGEITEEIESHIKDGEEGYGIKIERQKMRLIDFESLKEFQGW